MCFILFNIHFLLDLDRFLDKYNNPRLKKKSDGDKLAKDTNTKKSSGMVYFCRSCVMDKERGEFPDYSISLNINGFNTQWI
jgi:hypothetical protein